MFAACSTYTSEAGCVEGTDGACIWDIPLGSTDTTAAKSCRVKACQDIKNTTSAACAAAMTSCVSNGTNCIPKAACSSYTAKDACNFGGTDGLCAFTPGSTTTPNVGTCKAMTQCSDANSDTLACAAKSAVCSWKVTTSGSTVTTACNPQDCTTRAVGTDCNPVPSYDGATFSICVPSANGCVAGEGSTLNQASCFGDSVGTYTWNPTTSKCEACFTVTSGGGNNSGGGSSTGGSTYGTML